MRILTLWEVKWLAQGHIELRSKTMAVGFYNQCSFHSITWGVTSDPHTHHPLCWSCLPGNCNNSSWYIQQHPCQPTGPLHWGPTPGALALIVPSHEMHSSLKPHLGTWTQQEFPFICKVFLIPSPLHPLSSPSLLADPPFWVHYFLPWLPLLLDQNFQKDTDGLFPWPRCLAQGLGWSRRQCLLSELES